MSNQETYQQLCRDLASEPAHRRDLIKPQMAVALEYHDHILVETVDALSREILSVFAGTNPYLLSYDSPQELIGYLIHAGVRHRLEAAMKRDIEMAVDDLEQEARIDNEVHA